MVRKSFFSGLIRKSFFFGKKILLNLPTGGQHISQLFGHTPMPKFNLPERARRAWWQSCEYTVAVCVVRSCSARKWPGRRCITDRGCSLLRRLASATAGLTALCLFVAVVNVSRLPVTRTEAIDLGTTSQDCSNIDFYIVHALGH